MCEGEYRMMTGQPQPSGSKWWVNLFSFVLLVVLGSTGLINYAMRPLGSSATAFTRGLHRFLVDVHFVCAVFFVVVVTVHLFQHGRYIKKFFFPLRPPKT